MIGDNDTDMPEHVLRVSLSIQPFLRGQSPYVQGAVLADLVSIWLAGHPAHMRKELLDHLTFAIEQLVPASEEQIFGPHGHPQKEQPG